jgi:hypothetical protein
VLEEGGERGCSRAFLATAVGTGELCLWFVLGELDERAVERSSLRVVGDRERAFTPVIGGVAELDADERRRRCIELDRLLLEIEVEEVVGATAMQLRADVERKRGALSRAGSALVADGLSL